MKKESGHSDYKNIAINFYNISYGFYTKAEKNYELLKKREEFFNKLYEKAITPSASCNKASATQFEGRALETIFV